MQNTLYQRCEVSSARPNRFTVSYAVVPKDAQALTEAICKCANAYKTKSGQEITVEFGHSSYATGGREGVRGLSHQSVTFLAPSNLSRFLPLSSNQLQGFAMHLEIKGLLSREQRVSAQRMLNTASLHEGITNTEPVFSR